ncbi:hypothetical protein Dimus_000149 [Dionaea muscipula]
MRPCAHLLLFLLAVCGSFSVVSSVDEVALVFGQSISVEVVLVPSMAARDSPGGSQPSSITGAERVHLYGLSRMKNLNRFFHSAKVKVSCSSQNSSRRPSSVVEVCLHGNLSIPVGVGGMCPQGQWEKLYSKGSNSWVRTMSPFFDHRVLDVRAVDSSSSTALALLIDVTIEEEFVVYGPALLIVGMVLMTLAPTLGRSLVFYYGTGMVLGIIALIVVVLFQGRKLLPIRRRLFLFIFSSSIFGAGTLVPGGGGYLSNFLLDLLAKIGISEDLCYPIAIFLLLFLVIAGAGLGFWAVRKVVLTEDGSLDTNISLFTSFSIRCIGACLILSCSSDGFLVAATFLCTCAVSAMLQRASSKTRQVVSCRPCASEINHYHSIPYEYPFASSSSSSSQGKMLGLGLGLGSKQHSAMGSCNCWGRGRGVANSPTRVLLSDSQTFYSTFHSTPKKRRKFSKEEWDMFTRDHTKKALEELVSSPGFNEWIVANAERITLTPMKNDEKNDENGRKGKIG